MRIVTYCCDWCMQKSQNQEYVEKNWDDVEGQLLCRPCITARATALSEAQARRVREFGSAAADHSGSEGA